MVSSILGKICGKHDTVGDFVLRGAKRLRLVNLFPRDGLGPQVGIERHGREDADDDQGNFRQLIEAKDDEQDRQDRERRDLVEEHHEAVEQGLHVGKKPHADAQRDGQENHAKRNAKAPGTGEAYRPTAAGRRCGRARRPTVSCHRASADTVGMTLSCGFSWCR